MTLTLEEGLKIYPDSVPFRLTPISILAVDGYNVNKIEMDEHSGTHVDAPFHFYENGMSIGDIPVSTLLGKAVILDFSAKDSRIIELDEVEGALNDLGVNPRKGWYLFLKLKTEKSFKLVSEGVARYIVENDLNGLGVDSPSPDEYPYPIHKLLLGQGKIIIENLVLPSELDGTVIDVVVAPLKIKGGTGSPARVIGIKY
ncbi:MAG: cyclase family protein [Desulfurococcales archaeon]|nr:cyclase family protein [Desulfurococcales archaeon]